LAVATAAPSGRVSIVDAVQVLQERLERTRETTNSLLAPVPGARRAARGSPSHASLTWDLASVASFEETWLLRNLGGSPPDAEQHSEVYDAFRFEPTASKLPTLGASAVTAYAEDVRERVLAHLERIDLDAPDPLLRNGLVYGIALQNELEAQEKMLETVQLLGLTYPLPKPLDPPEQAPGGRTDITIGRGSFVLGALDEPWAYDNELASHEVEFKSFRIECIPVTNAAFARFVEDRGYRTRKLWTDDGWAWKEAESVEAPLYWERSDGGWQRTRFGRREPVPPDEPVQHVSAYEADAYARWAGKRLPTEVEWERAASWDTQSGKKRFPWGQEWMEYEANLDRSRFSPTPVGSFGGGGSSAGCLQMAGDVWEWTSSSFQSYPDFLAFPDSDASEAYFGTDYRVLKGGSWATDPFIARTTFRRFEVPSSRALFAGFRCARDA
jgi:gamma-glutamyl hercynylcysteine S-oxide synthase